MAVSNWALNHPTQYEATVQWIVGTGVFPAPAEPALRQMQFLKPDQQELYDDVKDVIELTADWGGRRCKFNPKILLDVNQEGIIPPEDEDEGEASAEAP